MKTVTFEQFVKDYNSKYNTYYGFIQTNTLDAKSIIYAVYGIDDFELNLDNETIELYE